MTAIELHERVDFNQLATLWKDLESRADASFFQSWAWVGCLASERFPHPVLLQARAGDATVALGLFNRRQRFGRSDLLLNESGAPQYDSVFVEHNGLLVERGRAASLVGDCLRRALTTPIGRTWRRKPHNLILSGVSEACLASLREGSCRATIRMSHRAPFVDLRALRLAGRNFLDQVSANTRYQLRRSRRRYAASGPLSIRRAGSVEEACDFVARLADLHQIYWAGRGQPGAFATADFRRFHQALIERAFPCGGIDLLRVSCGERPIGYLYNFRHQGTVSAYQSGFDYSAAETHQKPGLTCHHLAIEKYLAEGASRYDFLAGDDRYKLSLATDATTLYWLRVCRRRRFSALGGRLGGLAGTSSSQPPASCALPLHHRLPIVRA